MPQINLYVSDELEKRIRAEARRHHLSISAYVAGLLEKRIGNQKGWKEGFFTKVVGGWQGDVPEIERGPPEQRESL
jgi:hypothetical protein